jgi:hypothetical protein
LDSLDAAEKWIAAQESEAPEGGIDAAQKASESP